MLWFQRSVLAGRFNPASTDRHIDVVEGVIVEAEIFIGMVLCWIFSGWK